jgi:hypothetical protein
MGTEWGSNPPLSTKKIFEKLFKNPLTKPQKCGIIIVQ